MQKRFLRYINNADSGVLLWETAKENTSVLFLDCWVGIEGVLAVSSYPRLGEKYGKMLGLRRIQKMKLLFMTM